MSISIQSETFRIKKIMHFQEVSHDLTTLFHLWLRMHATSTTNENILNAFKHVVCSMVSEVLRFERMMDSQAVSILIYCTLFHLWLRLPVNFLNVLKTFVE